MQLVRYHNNELYLHHVQQIRVCKVVSKLKSTRFWRELTQRMTAAELRLLRILALQLITNAVKQLDVALLRVLLQRGDKCPAHSTSSLATYGRVGTVNLVSIPGSSIMATRLCSLGVHVRCLGILATTPHDNIRWTGLRPEIALVRIVTRSCLLEQAHGCACHATQVSTSIR